MEIQLILTVKVPSDCTKEQILEWASSEIEKTQMISLDNPLCDTDLRCERIEFFGH